MVEAEMCERCDGRGCRSCSGRGWVNKVLPEVPTCRKVYPRVTLQDIDEMSNWSTSPPAAEVESLPATKKDAEPHGRGRVLHGPLHCAVEGHFDDEPENWPPEVCRACNQATGIDERNGLCSDCNRELRKASPAAELQEPDEKVRITVEYPDARVKLIKVRWGTLAKALAEAFNGRPW